ncbi:rhodanese-like domain-containing protein [Isoptericola sp. NEAU-Y5]|uniref:Rhodanese-like domain-containing protein n=1 Tax=Isoptericola luteus TaxID=2879484 RepID=A0ABS7ZC76_9MICO|nr:rhodanese-like domain-containing protein [Isoptericola sp. NEAU-Y5]MCA5892062.1 rhodanese-like domain-containing protein [Isoptericola sp. NEAU-Y5]
MTAPAPTPGAHPEARPAPGYAGDLDPQQAWDLLATDPDAVLVDVRTEGEWRAVGVPDTRALDKDTVLVEWVKAGGRPNPAFLTDLEDAGVTAGRPVVFLCRSGQRSIGAARLATSAGIGPSYNILEGFEGGAGFDGARDHEGWKVRGLPWGELVDAEPTPPTGADR